MNAREPSPIATTEHDDNVIVTVSHDDQMTNVVSPASRDTSEHENGKNQSTYSFYRAMLRRARLATICRLFVRLSVRDVRYRDLIG